MKLVRVFVLVGAAVILAALSALILLASRETSPRAPSPTPTRLVAIVESPTPGVPTNTSVPAPSRTNTPLPTRVFIENTRLAWFYKPPVSNDVATLARNFDLFILTRLDEPMRDALRARGIRAPFLQYYRFDAIHDPGNCNRQPYHNQIAMNPGEYCALARDHPDWFLRDARGNLIANVSDGARYILMDPGNEGWRAYWLERARQVHEQYGWDGIFLDNVEASLSKLKRNGTRPAKYVDEAAYQSAVEGFLAQIASYTRAHNKPLFANIIALEDTGIWFRYLAYLDGAMEEAFAVDFNNRYLAPADWERDLARLEQTQALGKDVILVAQGTRADSARLQFAWATYLLINDGRAFFRYAASDAYDEIWLYREYEWQLGEPLGARYQNGNLWQRDFAKGTVAVDPISHTATITLR
jgi:hypothetical protein